MKRFRRITEAEKVELEKQGLRFVGAEILPSGLLANAEFVDVSQGFWVNVGNFRGTIVLAGKKADYSEDIYISPEKYDYDHDLAHQLIHQVIRDNDGSITWSGHYYPVTKKSFQLFQKFLKTLSKRGEK